MVDSSGLTILARKNCVWYGWSTINFMNSASKKAVLTYQGRMRLLGAERRAQLIIPAKYLSRPWHLWPVSWQLMISLDPPVCHIFRSETDLHFCRNVISLSIQGTRSLVVERVGAQVALLIAPTIVWTTRQTCRFRVYTCPLQLRRPSLSKCAIYLFLTSLLLPISVYIS